MQVTIYQAKLTAEIQLLLAQDLSPACPSSQVILCGTNELGIASPLPKMPRD